MRKLLQTLLISSALVCTSSSAMKPEDAARIAKEAYIYGYPMVQNYKTMYIFAIAKGNPEYKAPFNVLYQSANVATPQDTTVVTPNSDTPYSMLWADLRTEPLVLNVPEIQKDRYYSLQFIDLYTYNIAYIGTRTTGNSGGKYLLAGPNWKGTPPAGIKQVINADTDFVFVVYRTQLFNPQDLDNVKKIQAQYTVQPLSEFLQKPAPAAAPKIEFPSITAKKLQSTDFFNYLNFLLQFAPTVSDDKIARSIFASIGVEAGKPFTVAPELQNAILDGMRQGKEEIDIGTKETKSSEDLFGTREYLNNDYLNRAIGAALGLYGNSKQEAYYFTYTKDADDEPLNGDHDRYIMHFNSDEIPPVNAFWSVTMYDGTTRLLVANPINRYLINSPMLAMMHKDKDGGFSIYLQHNLPTKDKVDNWLPAPQGPMYVVLRLYWPKESVLNGSWQPPVIRKI